LSYFRRDYDSSAISPAKNDKNNRTQVFLYSGDILRTFCTSLPAASEKEMTVQPHLLIFGHKNPCRE
jgi:hypothetical protein